jgi:hypothetical protein
LVKSPFLCMRDVGLVVDWEVQKAVKVE